MNDVRNCLSLLASAFNDACRKLSAVKIQYDENVKVSLTTFASCDLRSVLPHVLDLQTTFLDNIVRYLNRGENLMDQAPVVHGQARGFFGHSMTLTIEEREYDYKFDGRDRKLFLLVRLSKSNIILFFCPKLRDHAHSFVKTGNQTSPRTVPYARKVRVS